MEGKRTYWLQVLGLAVDWCWLLWACNVKVPDWMSSNSTTSALRLTFAAITLVLWWEQVLCNCWFFLVWELGCTDSLSHLLMGSKC